MKNIVPRLCLCLSLAALALSGCEQPATGLPAVPEQDFRSGSVTVAADQALVIAASGTVTATYLTKSVPVKIGDLLTREQSVKTGPGSSCELQFGGGTAMRLEENTEVLLESVLVEAGRREISAAMKTGTLLCKVQKLSGKESFRVKTPTATCGVRGTEFVVTVSTRRDTLLVVKEGAVSLLPAALDPERLAADLAADDPDLAAAIAGLAKAERIVDAGQSAELTPEAAERAGEGLSAVAEAIKPMREAVKPSAAQLAKLNSVIEKTKAEVLKQVPAPRPQTEAEQILVRGLDDLKQHMLKSVRVGSDEAGPVTLTIWVNYPNKDITDISRYTQNLVTKFERDNPGIVIDWNSLGQNGFNEKVTAALVEKRGPDIFHTRGGRVFEALADDGRLLDLTEELSGVSAMEIARRSLSYGGRQYGVAPYIQILGLFINEDIFKRQGLAVPSTLEELETTAEKLKAKGIQPIASAAKDEWPILEPYMYLVNRRGGDAYARLVGRKIGFTSEPFVWAGRKLQEWTKKGYFGNAPLEEGYSDAVARLENGQAAMWVCGAWLCQVFSAESSVRFHPFPAIVGGQGDIRDVVGMPEIGFVAAQSSAAKKDAIAKFLNYVMTVEACRGMGMSWQVCTVSGVPLTNDRFEPATAILDKTKDLIPWWDQDLPPDVCFSAATAIKKLLVEGSDVEKTLAAYEAQLAKSLGPLKP